jgi:PTS system glucose-specific IIC component
MKSFQTAFSLLQRIGKCMMLPVSVLPVAGILLGVGSANFSWLPDPVSKVMAASGSVIFGSLPLLFAIGVAIGLTENDGVAALASTVGFAVFLASMGVFAGLLGIETKTIMGLPTIETGVFGGILVGFIAAAVFNRFYRVQLPSYLGFFAGKRSVPIITAFAAIALAAVLILIWPPIGRGIEGFSYWAVNGRPALAFAIYGIVERALIPFGLHHVWNVPFFFQAGSFTDPATGIVVHGEIARFIAGDPTAGHMTGGYLFKMWGLPAAAFAMWRAARPDQRAKVGGIMFSAALTVGLAFPF